MVFLNVVFLSGRFSVTKVLDWVCGWEGRALQECNLSAQLPVDCGCIPPPGPGQPGAGSFLFRSAPQAAVQRAKLIFLLTSFLSGRRYLHGLTH
jgi:hypothetical protein